MDAAAFRQAFASFVGDEQFKKFVVSGVRQGRLRYWQTQLWQQFLQARPEFDCRLEELADCLRICPLHHEELRTGVETVTQAESLPQRFVDIRSALFPYAIVNAAGEPLKQICKQPTEPIPIWYCPTCHAIASGWKAKLL